MQLKLFDKSASMIKKCGSIVTPTSTIQNIELLNSLIGQKLKLDSFCSKAIFYNQQ